MNDKIINISVTYVDGRTEQFPEMLVDKLAFHQGDHITLAGFIEEILHGWDKEYALEQQRQKLQQESQDKLQSLQQAQDKKHTNGLNIQRGKEHGLIWDKWAECLPDFPYHPQDVVPIPQPGDRLCFNGMVNNNIKEIIWMEYQIKGGVYEQRKKQIQQCLNENSFRYELYKPPKHWGKIE